MEFLNPKKQRSHTIRLLVGYVLIGLALVLATVILIYQANGFGIKNGQVIQNGLVFISSTPGSADVYINGQKTKQQTNTRFAIEAGQYTFELQRSGYRPWKRAITVEGGTIGRFDYPFLFPSKLTGAAFKKYDAAPGISLQSPDRRWLLVPSNTFGTFDMFDFGNPKKPVSQSISLPEGLLAKADGAQSWQLVEWSTDNRHVLLKHLFKDNQQSEYVMVDRQDVSKSLNLTNVLGTNPAQIALRNKAYDQYYLYDQPSATLSTADLKNPAPQAYLRHVLAFKAYGNSQLLYATDQNAPAGKVNINERDGDNTYTFRAVAAGSQYLLDLTQYAGSWYVVLGAASEGRTYVYKDPISNLKGTPDAPLVPVQIFKTAGANYISFSENARFIMAENGDSFSVYDAENDKGYAYTLKQPLDAPQTHATWMDGDRLSFVSGGKLVVFEFDDANQVTLGDALPAYKPAFSRDYTYLYTFAPQTTKAADGTDKTQYVLDSTPLRTPQDQ